MCGILGYTGNRQASDILLNGLAKLEYRGYDSAGVAVLKDEEIKIAKNKGRLKVLEYTLGNSRRTFRRKRPPVMER